MTIREAGAFIRLGRSTLYGLMERGDLPYACIGARRLIPWRALIELAANSLRPRDAIPIAGSNVVRLCNRIPVLNRKKRAVLKRRRGRGEGSIFRRSDGLWVGILSLGYGNDGRRRRRIIYGRDKSAVIECVTRTRAQALDGTLGDGQRVVTSVFLARWLDDIARPAISRSTHQLYEGLIRLHINPRVGAVQLSRLTPAQVQGMLGTMERDGASPRLRQMTLGVLHRALGQAVRWSMVPRNVCDAVTPPRVSRETMPTLSPEQVARLLDAAKGNRLEALYVLAVTTGLRQGELLGLQWNDVDLEGAVLRVKHALHELNGRLWIGGPKTRWARRQVDLPALAVVALQAHRNKTIDNVQSDSLVFYDTEGRPLRKSNLLRRSFLPLLKRAGLPTIRFHDLRHTAATLLLTQGVHPKIVQERLGHSQISLTLDTYSHVLPSMGRDAAAKLDSLLAKPVAGGAVTRPDESFPATVDVA